MKPISLRSSSRHSRGFTLIEVVVGLALMAMLIGGIFSVQRGAFTVSTEVVERETQTLRVHSFCELLRKNFEQAPGNAKINLQIWGGAGGEGLGVICDLRFPRLHVEGVILYYRVGEQSPAHVVHQLPCLPVAAGVKVYLQVLTRAHGLHALVAQVM